MFKMKKVFATILCTCLLSFSLGNFGGIFGSNIVSAEDPPIFDGSYITYPIDNTDIILWADINVSWSVSDGDHYSMSLTDTTSQSETEWQGLDWETGEWSSSTSIYKEVYGQETIIPMNYFTPDHTYRILLQTDKFGYIPDVSGVEFTARAIPTIPSAIITSPQADSLIEVPQNVSVSWNDVAEAYGYSIALQDNVTGQWLDMTTSPCTWTDNNSFCSLGDVTTTTIQSVYLTPGDDYTIILLAEGNGDPGFSSVHFYAGGRYEAEKLYISGMVGTHTITDSTYASKRKFDLYNASSTGKFIEYQVNVPVAGTYNVKARVMQDNITSGIYQLSINGINQGNAFDAYLAATPYTEYDLGSVTFNTEGNQTFMFTCTGKNSSSYGYKLPLDCITLTKQ